LVYLPLFEKTATSAIAVKAVRGGGSLLDFTQLRVRATRELDVDLELDSSYIQQQRLQMTELAFKLAKASQHLRHINVDFYSWRIMGTTT
jgi:hypothetical protein